MSCPNFYHMETQIKDVMIHLAGNKAHGQDLFLSDQPAKLKEEVRAKLCTYFINRFGHVYEHYRFSGQTGNRIVEEEAKQLFKDVSNIRESSKRIATHLYDCSTHPRIKPGEVYVTIIENYPFEGVAMRAVGIFKTEIKSGFFEVHQAGDAVEMNYREGIDINKFDKGCLILEHPHSDELIVLIVDQNSRGEEAVYWREHFLGLQQRQTSFSMTNLALQSTKEFVSDFLDQDHPVSKTEKIDLLNRSATYFKENDLFDSKEFEEEVLTKPDIIDSYRRYQQDRADRSEPVHEQSFGISQPAVKQQIRVFKSVLKLDKNFHIYIHGNREWIKRGTDPDGRKYYKIYFENEL